MRALAIVVLLAACSQGAPGTSLEVDRVMVHVASLMTLGPRPGDSDKARQAAAYIIDTLAAAKIEVERLPVGVVDLPAIELMGQRYRNAHRVETTDPDLVVRFGPPGKALLIMAHYDTVRVSPGAVDNAAAVAVLIELARAFAIKRPAIPVILAFTANEEIGLVGAEALAARIGGEVELAIALDLIGGSGALSLNGASELIGATEMRWLARAADRAGVVVRAPLPHRVVSRWWPQAERSDHGPFTRRGIRAFHLYDRGQDGEWIDLAYHSAGDVLARVDRRSVGELGALLLALSDTPIPAHGGDGFWMPIVHDVVIARWILIAFELALVLVALGALVSLRTPRERGGLGLAAGVACYAAAIGVALAVERLTAGSHPAPWLHAPLSSVLALAAVLGGSFGIAASILRRFWAWRGEVRYLVLATSVPLAIGGALLAIGAAELAWVWLVPAALLALAPRLGLARWLAVIASALPAVLVLAPDQLREAAWNGFLPIEVPLTAWVAGLGLPCVAAVAWAMRRRDPAGPLGSFILPVGCLLAILSGVVVVSRAHPPCTAATFKEFQLACERTLGVR